MALSTTHVTPARLKWKIGSTDYECDTSGFAEIVTQSGGGVTDTACGQLITPVTSTITGATITMIQGLQAAQIWQYLRENDSAGTEVLTYCFGTSYTAAATNPIWTVTLTGWTKPPVNWVAGASAGPPTTSCQLSFAAEPVVDFTP